MSAQANVTLNTVVYVPTGLQSGLASWVNRADGTPGAFSLLTESVQSPSATGKVFRAQFKLSVPIVATASTACSCAGDVLRTGNVEVTFLLPNTSTTAERTDLYLRFKDLVASGIFSDAIENLNIPTA